MDLFGDFRRVLVGFRCFLPLLVAREVTGYPSSMLLMSEASMESYFKLRYGEERALELQKLFEPEKIGWWSSYFQAAQACETDFSPSAALFKALRGS